VADPVLELCKDGVAEELLFETWCLLHQGNRHIGKALFASIPQASITNSRGIHISAMGTTGRGKTDSIEKALLLIPNKYKFVGDLTPQSVYYNSDNISPGTIVYIDDIQWNPSNASTMKKITSNFQQSVAKATNFSGEGKTIAASERLTFWCSQVDMQVDEQLRDRFMMVEATADPIKTVEFMQDQDVGVQPAECELSDQIQLAQDIVTLIRESGPYKVRIPYARRIKGIRQNRAYKMFSDTIKASAVFNCWQRERDKDGYILADESDFYYAKGIYDGIGGISGDKFSQREKMVLQAIRDNGGLATYSEIGDNIGEGKQTIWNIINGRSDNSQQRYGLAEKCGGMMKVESGRPVRIYLDPTFKFGEFSVWLDSS
jgi:hypothetical protein